jgi:hypothetical protein
MKASLKNAQRRLVAAQPFVRAYIRISHVLGEGPSWSETVIRC